jgi:DNA-binding response OmpR family regulator
MAARKYHGVMAAHVVVAEDDPLQAELLRRYLESEKYRVTVAGDGREVLEVVRREQPALLILDVMLPRVDGLDVCRILRAESDLPILMLTARSTEDDILLGLDLGADDYVTKPYSPRQLMARVRTLLRRSRVSADASGDSAVLGPIAVDSARHEVRVNGELVELTRAEFRLLDVLVENVGLVFSRAQLLDRIHGSDRFITERTIDVHVRNVRAKIEPDPSTPRHLLTVYGIGYKFATPEAGDDAPH